MNVSGFRNKELLPSGWISINNNAIKGIFYTLYMYILNKMIKMAPGNSN